MTTGATPQDATHVHDTEEGRIYYRCLPPQAPGAGVTWDKWGPGSWWRVPPGRGSGISESGDGI